MLTYPDINPVALDLGPLQIHWYGLMYLIGFGAVWWLGSLRTKQPHSPFTKEQIGDLVFYGAIGAVLGGRIGYILFYDFASFVETPLMIIKVWEGGMAFHGGLIGVLVAMWMYGRKLKLGFFTVTDFLAPLAPIGLCAGRIGNFINGELWGGPGNVPWAMQVPCTDEFWDLCHNKLQLPAGTPFTPPLHPNQLYEACLEGVVLFLILWFFSAKQRPRMAISGLFLMFYGLFRFCIEFVRMPDTQLGYLAFDWITMGQILSTPMIIAGVALIVWGYKRNPQTA